MNNDNDGLGTIMTVCVIIMLILMVTLYELTDTLVNLYI